MSDGKIAGSAITKSDLKRLRGILKQKGLSLVTKSGLSATVLDEDGSDAGVVERLLAECELSLENSERVAALEQELDARPTHFAYDQACKALHHWRREAARIGKLAGIEPRTMKQEQDAECASEYGPPVR